MSDSPLLPPRTPPTTPAQRRRLKGSHSFVRILCVICALLVSASLLVMGLVHHQAGRSQPHTLLRVGPGGAAASLAAGSQVTSVMGTPSGLDLQPDIGSVYLLLGAPTSMCWRNVTDLEMAFPESSHAHTRQPRGQPPPDHMCRVTDLPGANITAEDVLEFVREVVPCGHKASTISCTHGQVYSLRYAMHAAAQATLRYYMPPGLFYQAQLQHYLAMNPLLCGPQVYYPPDMQLTEEQLQQQAEQPPVLAAMCQLMPGLLRAMGAVASFGVTMDGRWDPTLPDVPGKYNPALHDPLPDGATQTLDAYSALEKMAADADKAALDSPYYLVAFAMYNGERVLPHYVLQMLAMVTYLPPGRVLVTCYESGSTDSTPQWLRLLQGLLDLMRIPSHFVIQGNMTRSGERIPFLARVRNQVLAPVYDPELYEAALRRVGSSRAREAPHKDIAFPADKIIYVNDPFFIWQDLIRLSHHNADLACGLDFQDTFGTLMPDVWPIIPEPKRRLMAAPQRKLAMDSRASQPLMFDHDALKGPLRHLQNQPIFRTLTDPIPAFYDIWVARDMAGKPFYWVMPMVHDLVGMQLLTQGLPTPVQCCWNAAAVMNAAPFKPGGLPPGTAAGAGPNHDRMQFRSHGEGECAASECTLLCNDLWRTGFRKVLVDPAVRLSYNPQVRNYMHGTVMNGMSALTWSDMRDKLAEQEMDPYAPVDPPPEVLCCPIPPGQDHVEWGDCFMDTAWMDPPNMAGTEFA